MLNLSDGIETLGSIQWGLLISLLIAWVVVGGALIKGVKSSGKVTRWDNVTLSFLMCLWYLIHICLDVLPRTHCLSDMEVLMGFFRRMHRIETYKTDHIDISSIFIFPEQRP